MTDNDIRKWEVIIDKKKHYTISFIGENSTNHTVTTLPDKSGLFTAIKSFVKKNKELFLDDGACNYTYCIDSVDVEFRKI